MPERAPADHRQGDRATRVDTTIPNGSRPGYCADGEWLLGIYVLDGRAHLYGAPPGALPWREWVEMIAAACEREIAAVDDPCGCDAYDAGGPS